MLNRFAPWSEVPRKVPAAISISGTFLVRFEELVAHEKEGGARGGADERGANASIDAAKATGIVETGCGLKASFQSVDGVEG